MSRTGEMAQGDLLPILDDTLYDDDGSALDLSTATGVELELRRRGTTTTTTFTATIDDATAGDVSYAWVSGDTDTAGDYVFQWIVTFTGGKPRRFPSKPGDYGSLIIYPDISSASV